MQGDSKTIDARPRLSILIADDDIDTVVTLAAMLRDEGHIVHTCASARVVVEAVERYRPDICLLDIVMPNKTGFTIAREVIAKTTPQERPVLIAVSGVFNSPSDEVILRSAGFQHFVRKGTDPKELLRLVNSYAGRPSSPSSGSPSITSAPKS